MVKYLEAVAAGLDDNAHAVDHRILVSGQSEPVFWPGHAVEIHPMLPVGTADVVAQFFQPVADVAADEAAAAGEQYVHELFLLRCWSDDHSGQGCPGWLPE